jgi:hypothetical protein
MTSNAYEHRSHVSSLAPKPSHCPEEASKVPFVRLTTADTFLQRSFYNSCANNIRLAVVNVS